MGYNEWRHNIARKMDAKADEIEARQKEQKPMSERDKLAKRGNILIKGFAFWYLLPFIGAGIFIVVLLFAWLLSLVGII